MSLKYKGNQPFNDTIRLTGPAPIDERAVLDSLSDIAIDTGNKEAATLYGKAYQGMIVSVFDGNINYIMQLKDDSPYKISGNVSVTIGETGNYTDYWDIVGKKLEDRLNNIINPSINNLEDFVKSTTITNSGGIVVDKTDGQIGASYGLKANVDEDTIKLVNDKITAGKYRIVSLTGDQYALAYKSSDSNDYVIDTNSEINIPKNYIIKEVIICKATYDATSKTYTRTSVRSEKTDDEWAADKNPEYLCFIWQSSGSETGNSVPDSYIKVADMVAGSLTDIYDDISNINASIIKIDTSINNIETNYVKVSDNNKLIGIIDSSIGIISSSVNKLESSFMIAEKIMDVSIRILNTSVSKIENQLPRLDKSDTSIRILNTSVSNLENTVISLRSDILPAVNKNTGDIKDANSSISRANTSINKLESSYIKLSSDLTASNASINNIETTYVKTIDLVKQSNVFDGSLIILNASVNRLESADLTITKNINNANSSISDIKSDISSKNYIITSALSVIDSSLTKIDTSINTLERNYVDVTSIIGTINTSIGKINTSIISIKNDYDSVRRIITTDLDDINKSIDVINSSLLRDNSSINGIEKHISISDTSITDINASIINIDSSILKSNSSINTLESHIIVSDISIFNIKNDIIDIDGSIHSINSSILKSNSSINELERHISISDTSISKINTNITGMTGYINTLNTSVGIIDISVNKLESESENTSINLNTTTRRVYDLERVFENIDSSAIFYNPYEFSFVGIQNPNITDSSSDIYELSEAIEYLPNEYEKGGIKIIFNTSDGVVFYQLVSDKWTNNISKWLRIINENDIKKTDISLTDYPTFDTNTDYVVGDYVFKSISDTSIGLFMFTMNHPKGEWDPFKAIVVNVKDVLISKINNIVGPDIYIDPSAWEIITNNEEDLTVLKKSKMYYVYDENAVAPTPVNPSTNPSTNTSTNTNTGDVSIIADGTNFILEIDQHVGVENETLSVTGTVDSETLTINSAKKQTASVSGELVTVTGATVSGDTLSVSGTVSGDTITI
jgi:predicted  nucleic acid-binding Zn-ribbon protein